MPDLNLDNPSVREEILKIAEYWMAIGVDGFRLDAVTHYYEGNNTKNIEFLAWLQTELEKVDDDVYIVAEAWSDGGTILKLHESQLNSFFNFSFADSTGKIVTSVKMKKGSQLASDIAKWQEDVKAVNPDGIDAVFLSNHDNSRSGGALNRDLSLQKMGANVYMLMPGNPFIYYGEELGMVGSGRDENKRQPFIWSTTDVSGMTNPPINSDTVKQPVEGLDVQIKDGNSLVNHYKKLIAIKNSYPEIARGSVKALDLGNDNICAYKVSWLYEEAERTVWIVHNLSKETEEVDLTALGELKLVETLNCLDVEAEGSMDSMMGLTTYILK